MELLIPDHGLILSRIEFYCKNLGIDPKVFAAIVEVESSFNPYAVRYEPASPYRLKPDHFAKKNFTTEATETMLQKCSFGLGQIMLSTARDMGFKDCAPKLFEIDINLFWCTIYYNKVCHRFKLLDEQISAYNAGSIRLTKFGSFVNQTYVEKVNKVMDRNSAKIRVVK